ncbi:hypothetical protein [Streptomyces sp. NPDC057580]|uniref:hypothetical protein n=1 Tax=Streptomyces sp. NPDC057580 TaxID=3346173 RepID=UPI0036B768D1
MRASWPWSRRERRRAARHDGGQGCPAPCPTDLGNAPDRLRGSLPDRGFIDDSGPWLDATESWATATRTALRMVEAARAGKGAQAWEFRQQLPALVAEAKSFTYTGLDGRKVRPSRRPMPPAGPAPATARPASP